MLVTGSHPKLVTRGLLRLLVRNFSNYILSDRSVALMIYYENDYHSHKFRHQDRLAKLAKLDRNPFR